MSTEEAQVTLPPLALDDTMQDFHLEEYKQVKGEAFLLLARLEALFRYAIIVVAATYTWLITNTLGLLPSLAACLKAPKTLVILGWLVPPLFVAAAGIASKIGRDRVDTFGAYLKRVEDVLGHPLLGWEKHLAKSGDTITKTGMTAWYGLLAVTFVASLLGAVIVLGACAACTAK